MTYFADNGKTTDFKVFVSKFCFRDAWLEGGSMFALRSILIASICMLATNVCAAEHLIVNTGFTPPVSTIINRILTHATQKMGMTIEFHEMPGERALALAGQGVADGECCRVPEIVLREYHNLLPVFEGVSQVNFSAFTKQPNVVINRWEDLKPYTVGTVTGWKILVQNMQRIVPRETIVLDTPDSLFRCWIRMV